MKLMKGGMKDHAHAETLISQIDGKIQGFWDPIPVSPDTVETTTDFAGDDEEVNYPADAFGGSLSGNFNFDLGFEVNMSCLLIFNFVEAFNMLVCSYHVLRCLRPMKHHVNAIIEDDFWQVVKEEKLQEGDFEVESLMSFGGSHWCRSTPDTEHRSIYTNTNRSTGTPEHRSTTPTDPDKVRIDRHANNNIDRHTEAYIDRQPSPPIDRRAPITYRVQMPVIDVARLNALRPKPKPSEQPSEDGDDPMEEDRVSTGRTLRRRKEKVAKHLKSGANEKEKENFQK
ncbi:hypothetical protein F2Q69_00015743 [Brassica cretica]|uniref:Uncharacterized protein n=1 Tax=Brassica cretica TaxID=69181 RepID=A0A8S9QNQ4_BRACR|nr:hypothetical protein F2Q69_00015743 [Brassica cretica]